MNVEVRLAEIISALEAMGLSCLVMGGHAVRYYGVDRNKVDYDLHVAPDHWNDLAAALSQTSLFAGRPLIEGPSWRPAAFRRFQIGTLPSGREEWLEFWRENHLLAPFPELYSRREQGKYGGRTLAFLSLLDLIRSKETERESDWQDIAFLEEFLDARLLAQAKADVAAMVPALAQLRSRRGFESALQHGYLNNPHVVEQALAMTKMSITQAFLLPCAPEVQDLPVTTAPMEAVVQNRVRSETAGSHLHLALVEVVRRQYKIVAQADDKANKQAIREAQTEARSPGE